MATRLDVILANTRLGVAERMASADIAGMEAAALSHPARGFTATLRATAATGPAIIAELKKASPSRGLIRANFNPEALARTLADNGAAALSVLTDERFFQGSLAYLEVAFQAVTIPVLRKDFIVDPFQILEAKASGADAILLIVAALTDGELRDLGAEARRWGLDVLCEAHDRTEVDRAVQHGFDTIGINSRDLKTLQVHPDALMDLAAYLPSNCVRVAESGIGSPAEIERLRSAGYHAFLVGEALMRQPDPGEYLAMLLQRTVPVQA